MRPLLYVAAPYTRFDPIINTHRVVKVAEILYEETEYVPVIPHLSMLWHLISPKPTRYWYDYDLHLLGACNAILRLPGASTGADAEFDEANRLRLTEFHYIDLPAKARKIWEHRFWPAEAKP